MQQIHALCVVLCLFGAKVFVFNLSTREKLEVWRSSSGTPHQHKSSLFYEPECNQHKSRCCPRRSNRFRPESIQKSRVRLQKNFITIPTPMTYEFPGVSAPCWGPFHQIERYIGWNTFANMKRVGGVRGRLPLQMNFKPMCSSSFRDETTYTSGYAVGIRANITRTSATRAETPQALPGGR